MQQHGSKFFTCRPPPPPLPPRPWGRVQKINIQLFSEYGHVAYQIKGRDACSIMVANILPAEPPTLVVGSKGQNSTFSEHGHFAYHIKWNHECSNMVANILSTDY